MKHVTKLGITIITGVLALLFEFILHQPNWRMHYFNNRFCNGVNDVLGNDSNLREGKYGVDILAITAIVATLAVGEYWASLMIFNYVDWW